MRAALLLLLALAAEAEPQRVVNRVGVYPRADRRDREQAGISGPSGPLLSILPSGASIPGGECSGTAVTGINGEALTFARSSSATCQKSDGLFVQLASNQMRASSRPGFPSLLLEGAITNYVLQSRNMTSPTWTKTNAVCLKNSVGIDGASNSASACAASAPNASVTQTLASPGGGTLSVFIKRVSGIGTPTFQRGSVSYPLNYEKCRTLVTDQPANISSSEFVRCYFENSDSIPQIGITFANIGDSFVIDAWQDEPRNPAVTPTSPVFTTTASVTRSADILSVGNPAGLTNSDGCVASRIYRPSTLVSGTNFRLFSFSSGTRVYVPGDSVAWTDGYGWAYTYAANLAAASDVISTWSGSTISVRINGALSATSGYGGTVLDSAINIGSDSDGTGAFVGYVGAIRIDKSATGCSL